MDAVERRKGSVRPTSLSSPVSCIAAPALRPLVDSRRLHGAQAATFVETGREDGATLPEWERIA